MAVRCSKCGEELLGAVNRCWKCGQTFAAHPEIDGRPPVRQGEHATMAQEPLEAVVLDKGGDVAMPSAGATPSQMASPVVVATAARHAIPAPVSTAERIDAQRHGMMAMGGTIGSLVLACFALALAPFRFEAAVIALLGLGMGIWGLYSPRRKLAFAAMILCCLAIGWGAYTGARQLHIYIMKTRGPGAADNGG